MKGPSKAALLCLVTLLALLWPCLPQGADGKIRLAAVHARILKSGHGKGNGTAGNFTGNCTKNGTLHNGTRGNHTDRGHGTRRGLQVFRFLRHHHFNGTGNFTGNRTGSGTCGNHTHGNHTYGNHTLGNNTRGGHGHRGLQVFRFLRHFHFNDTGVFTVNCTGNGTWEIRTYGNWSDGNSTHPGPEGGPRGGPAGAGGPNQGGKGFFRGHLPGFPVNGTLPVNATANCTGNWTHGNHTFGNFSDGNHTAPGPARGPHGGRGGPGSDYFWLGP